MRAAGALRPVPGRGAQPPPRSPGAALPCDLSPVPEGGGRWALREEEARPACDSVDSTAACTLDSADGETEGPRELRPRVRAVGKQAHSLPHALTSSRADEWLPYRRPRAKDAEAKEAIAAAVRQHPVCALLEEQAITTMVEIAEFFAFEAGRTLLSHGDVGHYFFVVHEGVLQVTPSVGHASPLKSSPGGGTRLLTSGDCHGGSAVLFSGSQSETVVATEASGVWGIRGDTFRKVLSDDAMQHYEKNYGFLDSIRLFDGFSARQKQQLGKLALFSEVHEAGSLVQLQGEEVRAIRFVKEGALSVFSGLEVDDAGCAVPGSGSRVSRLSPGDSFGKSAALYGMGDSRISVLCDARSELLCIGVGELRQVLGADLSRALERSFVLACVEKSPFLSQFTLPQRRRIAEAMVIKDYQASQKLDVGGLEGFIILLSGDISGTDEGSDLHLDRGQVRESFNMGEYLDDFPRERSHSSDSLPDTPKRSSIPLPSFGLLMKEEIDALASDRGGEGGSLRAGPQGARIATITEKELMSVLRELGMCSIWEGSSREAMEHARRVQAVQKVRCLRHLPLAHLDAIVRALIRERRKPLEVVFEAGETASDCWIVLSGQAEELRPDGEVCRAVREGECLGAPALALEGLRPLAARAGAGGAELLRLERHDFEQLLPRRLREELAQQFQLQGSPVELQDLRHVRVIGSGAFGSVRCVEHRMTRFRYALKRVKLVDGQVPVLVARERDLLSEADHPFILRMAGAFDTEWGAYLLTELLTGGELLAALDAVGRVLTRQEAQFYAGSLILALEFLHEANIVFRDLKPENVMLDTHGYLRLIDFGIAKKLPEGTCRTFTIIGSFHFMAPEVARGKGYGTEVDVWSLGVMLFEFVCGILPFGRELPANSGQQILRAAQEENLSFPEHYKDAAGKHCIRGMLRKEPERRLGAGMHGFEAIKTHDFFSVADGEGSLFDRILSREARPPYVPSGEIYGDPDTLKEVSLSDAETFA